MTRTLDQAQVATARALRDGGAETPALDARLLLCLATGLSHEALIAHGCELIAPDEAARLAGYVARRLAGEPVSRIKGVRDFYGRDFLIDSETLDPRPDTETLVDAALEAIARDGAKDRPLKLLDLGTGSGCILVTLLAELPRAEGVGTDISARALLVAGENARRLGVAPRARFLAADWLDGVEGVIRPDRLQPALYPGRRDRGSCPGGRHLRPEACARRRPRRARCLPAHRQRGFSPFGARRAAFA